MNDSPRVSIIIPTYNRAQYLEQAIKSALNQDYPNKEIIVSDNASTDNTFEVVKQFMDYPEFKYFRNKTNIGMVPNWRKALYEYATGEYAIILSDDDFFIDGSYISKAIALFKKYPNLGFVFANCVKFYQHKGFAIKTTNQFLSVMDGREFLFSFRGSPIVFCTVVFNTNLAKQVQAFSEEVFGADILLWRKMMLFSDVGFINDLVAVYRLHGKNEILNLAFEKILQNIVVITKPAEMARQIGLDSSVVESWEERELKDYIVGYLRVVDLLKVYDKYGIGLSQVLKKIFKELARHIFVFLIGYKKYLFVREIVYEKIFGKKLPYSVVRDNDDVVKILSGECV